ncbi:uncharacterized protein LOC144335217 [Macaca mulatta]
MCGHGREGEEGMGRRRVGRPLRGGDGGGRGAPGSPRGRGAGARDDTSPRSTCRRPMETQLLRRSIEWRTDLGDPPGFLGAPAPSSRESGAKVLAPQEMRPSSPSLRRGDSASLPRPAKRRCRRQTDAHPRLLGPPGTPAPHGAGRPSPAGPVQRVPWRPRLPASASGAVLSGPGGGASAGPAPPPPPAGRAACLVASAGRDRAGDAGEAEQQRPQLGRPGHPARTARRHLGSRLLTARAALSNSLQSGPPTPGPAPGPRPRPPPRPGTPSPCPSGPRPRPAARAAAVRGADQRRRRHRAAPSGSLGTARGGGPRALLIPHCPTRPPAALTSARPAPAPSARPAPASPGQPWLSIVTVGTGGNSLQPWSPRSTPTRRATPRPEPRAGDAEQEEAGAASQHPTCPRGWQEVLRREAASRGWRLSPPRLERARGLRSASGG